MYIWKIFWEKLWKNSFIVFTLPIPILNFVAYLVNMKIEQWLPSVERYFITSSCFVCGVITAILTDHTSQTKTQIQRKCYLWVLTGHAVERIQTCFPPTSYPIFSNDPPNPIWIQPSIMIREASSTESRLNSNAQRTCFSLPVFSEARCLA